MPLITFNLVNPVDTSKLIEKTRLKLFLAGVFKSNQASFDQIKSALLAFHKDEGGSPDVPGFEITNCWYDDASKTGKVRFEYEVFFTFGCADIYPVQKSAETTNFSIDLIESKLLLVVTDHITRDTIDEF